MSTITLSKWGNSVGVRLSQQLLHKVGLHVGDQVDVEFQDGLGVILRPAVKPSRPRVDVSSMIVNITADTLPDASEFDTHPVGSEVW